MIHATFSQWNMENKRVFLRADLNVPLLHGNITNDFRLTGTLPTIDFILNKRGSIVLATHIDRPKNKEPELSTQHLIPWFKQRGYSILFVPDINSIAQHVIAPQQILLKVWCLGIMSQSAQIIADSILQFLVRCMIRLSCARSIRCIRKPGSSRL